MKKSLIILFLVAILLTVSGPALGTEKIAIVPMNSSPATALPGNTTTDLTVSEIAKNLECVVLIRIYDSKGKELGLGSGFVVRENGVIVTNYHVIGAARARLAKVELENGQRFEVKSILGYDKEHDLAVLKIDAAGLKTVKLGDSTKITLGEKVVAIGSPIGLQNTISDGIISSVNRPIDGQNFIQISAPISHGSSGGPLFNMKGEVIGVTSASVLGGQNLNLAIPINEAVKLINKQDPTTLEEINGQKPDGKKMSDEKFLAYLYDKYTTANIKEHMISADDVEMYMIGDKRDVRAIIISFNSKSFGQFRSAMADGHKAELEKWLTNIAKQCAANYLGEKMIVCFGFNDFFEKYPDSFSKRNITEVDDGWEVYYIPFGVSVNTKGKITKGPWMKP